MRGCCDKNNIEKYIDVSCIPSIDWDSIANILGVDSCGNIVVLDKPLHELSEEDRQKLDKIIITGSGNGYLTDNGEYKELDIDSVSGLTTEGEGNRFLSDDGTYKYIEGNAIILVYTPNSNDFTAANIEQLAEIRKYIAENRPLSTYIRINGFHYPLNVVFSDATLTLVFDEVLYDVVNSRSISDKVKRLRFEAVIQDNSLINYEFTYTDAGIIRIDGDGNSFLSDDGRYVNINLPAIVYYNENDDILTRNNIILANDHKLLGTSPSGAQFNLIELSRWNIINVGSLSEQLNFNSIGRPTVQLQGETGSQAHPVAFLSDVTSLSQELQQQLADLTDNYTTLTADYNGFKQSVNDTLNGVAGEIGDLDTRISQNTTDIRKNTGEIEQLREDFTNEQHYKGTFLTDNEIKVLQGDNGAYAYSLESGTIWVYNTATSKWEDSGDAIPSGIVSPSDNLPLMDNTASAGSSTEYARGDHRHPSDTTKANVTDLDNYLPLKGNTQLTKMDGDIWLGTGNHLRLTDSGNTYVNHENDTTVINSTGTGGINLVTPNGTSKVNGSPIATIGNIVINGLNDKNIQVSAPIIQFNSTQGNPAGFSMALGVFQLSGISLYTTLTGTVNITTTGGNIVLNPTSYKLFYGSADFPINEISTIGNIEEAKAEIENKFINYYTSTETDVLLDNKADVQQLNNYLLLSGGNISGSLTINDVRAATIEDIPGISSSDTILTLDNSGLKGNLSLITENGTATLYGKDNTVIGTINLNTGDIQDAYYDEENKELVFIIKTETGTDTITIPVGDLIQTYTGSRYISIDSDNTITLNYNLLSDQLLNDNFIKSDALNNYYTKPESNDNLTASLKNYLPLSGGTMNGDILFTDKYIRFNGIGNIVFTKNVSEDELRFYTFLVTTSTGTYTSYLGADNTEGLVFSLPRGMNFRTLNNHTIRINGTKIATVNDIPDVSGFATTTQLNTKADKVNQYGDMVVYAPNGEININNYLPLTGGQLTGNLLFYLSNLVLNNNTIFLSSNASTHFIRQNPSTGQTQINSGSNQGLIISNTSNTGNIEINTVNGKFLVNGNEIATKNDIVSLFNIRNETLQDWIFSVNNNEMVNFYYELTEGIQLVDHTPGSVTKGIAYLVLNNNNSQKIRVFLPSTYPGGHDYYIPYAMSGTSFIDVPSASKSVIQINYTESGAIITIESYTQLIV